MKIRLAVSDESMEEVRQFLTKKGIEIDDESEFVLTQNNNYVGHITVRKQETNEKMYLSVDEIITIESYGHSVEVHGQNGVYITSDRLYQLVNMLHPEQFIRVSNSVIVAKNKIKEIKPTLSMKFILVMQNNAKVDVTRTYYNSFKESFNI